MTEKISLVEGVPHDMKVGEPQSEDRSRDVAVEACFVIWDCVTERSSPPYVATNVAGAKRAYHRFLKEQKIIDPKEYALYLIGWYDRKTMIFISEIKILEGEYDSK